MTLPQSDRRPGDPIPPVDPDDLRRVWKVKPPWTAHSHEDACSPGADVHAVVSRSFMLTTLTHFDLLTPWTHGDQFDDAVFRLAAIFPLHVLEGHDYKIPGDERFPFDPNAFLQRLVEETGIPHTWEPVPVKVPEGGRVLILTSAAFAGQIPNPDREARYKARELLWAIWHRLSAVEGQRSPISAQRISELEGILFADFLIANPDLIQQVVDGFRNARCAGMDLMMEVEQRVQRRI